MGNTINNISCDYNHDCPQSNDITSSLVTFGSDGTFRMDIFSVGEYIYGVNAQVNSDFEMSITDKDIPYKKPKKVFLLGKRLDNGQVKFEECWNSLLSKIKSFDPERIKRYSSLLPIAYDVYENTVRITRVDTTFEAYALKNGWLPDDSKEHERWFFHVDNEKYRIALSANYWKHGSDNNYINGTMKEGSILRFRDEDQLKDFQTEVERLNEEILKMFPNSRRLAKIDVAVEDNRTIQRIEDMDEEFVKFVGTRVLGNVQVFKKACIDFWRGVDTSPSIVVTRSI